MFTNYGSFNEGAVVSGYTDESSIIIRCNTHQVQRHSYRLSVHLCTMSHFIDVYTNCGSFNEGAVVSGNTDETSIIRCNIHHVQKAYRLGGQLCTMSHFIDVH